MSAALVELAKQVVTMLRNIKAIIFEIFPGFVVRVGLESVRMQIEQLHGLWELRGRASANMVHSAVSRSHFPMTEQSPSLASWERALGSLVMGRISSEKIANELINEPGVNLVSQLINEFRGSMLVNTLRLTCRLMMLALGKDIFLTILQDFWSRIPPQMYAFSEAEQFADYLENLDLQVPQLSKILEFERAILKTLADNRTRVVQFVSDPLPLLRALAEGHLPEISGQLGDFEIELTPNAPVSAPRLNLF